MTSVHPPAFLLPYAADAADDARTAPPRKERVSPAATLAVLVASSFAIWLGILLLLSAIWETLNRDLLSRQNRIGFPREDLYV